jgi:hypothetical protein
LLRQDSLHVDAWDGLRMGHVFHLDPDGSLLSMTASAYLNEERLHELVQMHPDLLGDEQLQPGSPRRWAVVLPSGPGSAGRSGVSLYLDQDGVPTLVSVRRAAEEAQRRDVVGQVLDLAANGLRRWPIAEVRATFETTQRRLGRDPSVVLETLCAGGPWPAEELFSAVEANLATGRLRIVILAHQIPVELIRITELLNDQMSPMEILALELTQFRADSYIGAIIVPAVVARTTSRATHVSRHEPVGEQSATEARETWQLVGLLAQLATAAGLDVVESDTSVGVQMTDGETLASVDLEWGSLSVPLQRLPSDDVQTASAVLAGLTRARLDPLHPSVPAQRVVPRWKEVRPLLERLAVARQGNTPNGHRH